MTHIYVYVTYISTRFRDSCFLTYSEDYAFVKEKRGDGTFVCDVVKQRHTEIFVSKPCASKLLNIAFVNDIERAVFTRKLLYRDDFDQKVACLPHHNGYVLLPMRHGVD